MSSIRNKLCRFRSKKPSPSPTMVPANEEPVAQEDENTTETAVSML